MCKSWKWIWGGVLNYYNAELWVNCVTYRQIGKACNVTDYFLNQSQLYQRLNIEDVNNSCPVFVIQTDAFAFSVASNMIGWILSKVSMEESNV
jgi:hypothetical protein